MGAVGTVAAIGGALFGALKGKQYTPNPTIIVPQKAPDPAVTAQQTAEAAQYAAAVERRRAQGQMGATNTVATSPVGLPTPAPVQRKTLLGQ